MAGAVPLPCLSVRGAENGEQAPGWDSRDRPRRPSEGRPLSMLEQLNPALSLDNRDSCGLLPALLGFRGHERTVGERIPCRLGAGNSVCVAYTHLSVVGWVICRMNLGTVTSSGTACGRQPTVGLAERPSSQKLSEYRSLPKATAKLLSGPSSWMTPILLSGSERQRPIPIWRLDTMGQWVSYASTLPRGPLCLACGQRNRASHTSFPPYRSPTVVGSVSSVGCGRRRRRCPGSNLMTVSWRRLVLLSPSTVE